MRVSLTRLAGVGVGAGCEEHKRAQILWEALRYISSIKDARATPSSFLYIQ